MVPPEDDAKRYLHETYALLDHGELPSVWASPGYPLFLAFVFTIAGRDNFSVLLGVHLILRILTFLFASLLVWKVTKSRLYAFCTLLFLWSPAFMSQTRYIYTETLSAFLAMSAIYAYYHSVQNKYSNYKYLLWFLSSIFIGFLALVRPVYQALILVWWISEIPCVRRFTEVRRWLLTTMVFWLTPAIILVGGWSLRNQMVNGFFGLDALAGFRLCSKTVAVLERLPDDYAIERDLLILARDKDLVEPHQGHKGYLYWEHAVPSLQAATGLSIPDLSKRLLRMNLELIRLAPLHYLYEVATSFAVMWLPNISPQEAFGRAGQALFSFIEFFVHLLYLSVIAMLVSLWTLFGSLKRAEQILTCSDGNLLWMNKQIAVFTLYTLLISAATHVGQTRFIIPVEPLMLVSVVSMVHFVARARRSLLS